MKQNKATVQYVVMPNFLEISIKLFIEMNLPVHSLIPTYINIIRIKVYKCLKMSFLTSISFGILNKFDPIKCALLVIIKPGTE